MFIVIFGMNNYILVDRGNMAVESDLPDREGLNIDNAVGTADRRFGLLHSRDDEIRCMRKDGVFDDTVWLCLCRTSRKRCRPEG